MIDVVHISRSAASLRVGQRSLTVFGEAHEPVPGSPGWVIYSNDIHWDSPYEKEPVDDDTRHQVIQTLTRYFANKHTPFTVD